MKLLLDTHILLWWLDDDQRLRRRTRALIADPANTVHVSIASLWEIAIKRQIGKLQASAPTVAADLTSQGFELLDISIDHLTEIEALPRHHADPFDHLIVVQAKLSGARVVTQDKAMTLYGVPCIGNG